MSVGAAARPGVFRVLGVLLTVDLHFSVLGQPVAQMLKPTQTSPKLLQLNPNESQITSRNTLASETRKC